MTRARIGVDLGGTKTEVIVMNQARTTLMRERVSTPAHDYEAIVKTIAGLVAKARNLAGPQATVGVGTPGSLSKQTGAIVNANSTVLIGKPLKEDLERALECRIRMANDANCFLLSEALDGAAAGAPVAFGVILGTGVGGALSVNGRVLGGANGIAGEWGHNPLPWQRADELPGPRCYCGKLGCIETFLSGPALARSGAAMDVYADRLARALASVVNIADPDVIVLGGGVSNRPEIYDTVPRLLPHYVFSDAVRTRLLRARHGDSSGVRGAAMLWEEGAHDE